MTWISLEEVKKSKVGYQVGDSKGKEEEEKEEEKY